MQLELEPVDGDSSGKALEEGIGPSSMLIVAWAGA